MQIFVCLIFDTQLTPPTVNSMKAEIMSIFYFYYCVDTESGK